MKLNTLILGLLLVAFIGQLAVADNPDKPNVLFIAVDDLNDWAGYRGHSEVITPNMDRLAKKGLGFLELIANTLSVERPAPA